MRQKILIALLLSWIFLPRAWALTGPLGASNLERGDQGSSLLFGLDVPEAMFYGLRYDYGFSDWFQLGFNATYSGIYLGTGIQTRLMLLQTESEKHRIGLDGTADWFQFWRWGNQKGVFLSPLLFYDFQFGFLNENSLYLKGGTASVYVDVDETNFLSFFVDNPTQVWEWSTAVTGKVGYQREVSERVNFMIEGGAFYDLRTFKIVPRGQLGISYVF